MKIFYKFLSIKLRLILSFFIIDLYSIYTGHSSPKSIEYKTVFELKVHYPIDHHIRIFKCREWTGYDNFVIVLILQSVCKEFKWSFVFCKKKGSLWTGLVSLYDNIRVITLRSLQKVPHTMSVYIPCLKWLLFLCLDLCFSY